jgi:hypothetical protein
MLRSFGVILLLTILLILPGCDSPTDPSPTDPWIPGVRETWDPSGAHVLRGTVRVDTLTIQAGTHVCGEPGAVLLVRDRLEVNGTADRPVVFTACDPAEGWGGLAVSPEWGSSGSGRLEHVLIEYADQGIEGMNLEIVDARIRQTRGAAIRGGARVRNATIDTACTSGLGSAVMAAQYTLIELENVTIRGSGGAGVSRGRRAPIVLRDVVIEGSADVGLELGGHIIHNSLRNFTVEGDLRLTDNLYPAHLGSHDIPQLLPTLESYDRVLGNRRDTLIVGITSSSEPLTVRAVLPWRVYDGISIPSGAALPAIIEPGATIAGATDGPWSPVRLALRAGTALEGVPGGPITFLDLEISIQGDVADTTRIRHVHLERSAVLTTTRQGISATTSPIVLEEVRVRDGRVELTSAGSRIERLFALGGVSDTTATVRLAGAGIVARNLEVRQAPGPGVALDANDILLDGCRVSEGLADGVRIPGGVGIRIRACNLLDNAGAGVANSGTDEVDARENWWGDPEGPFGPSGDGAIGPVEFTPWLAAPAAPPLSPARSSR